MATYLLDTSVIIDVLKRKLGRPALLRNILQGGHLLACCAINITEIYAGLRPQDEKRTVEFLDSLAWYEVTRQIARRAGLYRWEYSRKGITLSLADATIAAVAGENNLILMTDNMRHFRMPELALYKFQHPIERTDPWGSKAQS
jgi:hypothetical protein